MTPLDSMISMQYRNTSFHVIPRSAERSYEGSHNLLRQGQAGVGKSQRFLLAPCLSFSNTSDVRKRMKVNYVFVFTFIGLFNILHFVSQTISQNVMASQYPNGLPVAICAQWKPLAPHQSFDPSGATPKQAVWYS